MTANATTGHDPTQRRKWLGLAALCAAFFMVILDVAIVNVALPTIQVDLGFSQRNLQWVVSAYALTFGGLLLLGGRAADLLGRRRMLIAGLALGLSQQMRGAHFMSHTLWTAWFCWVTALAIDAPCEKLACLVR